MNAITIRPPVAENPLMPTNLQDAMKLADMMARGKLVPQALQQSPSDCLMVIEQSVRWGMSPFAVAQEVSVIQGKMMYSGKIVAAALHTSGVLEGRLSYEFEGTNGDLAVTVSGLLRGEAEPRAVTVRLKDAKTANQHWAKSPEQMLSYHAARVWARRHAPEVMLGVYVPEEFEPERAEPRQVQSTVERQGPTLDDVFSGSEPPPPKPDRLREAADRIKARMDECFAGPDHDSRMATFNKWMAHEGIKAEWDKMRKDRPELAEELDAYRADVLNRLVAGADREAA